MNPHAERRLVELYDALNAIHWQGQLPAARRWSDGDGTSPGVILRAYQERASLVEQRRGTKTWGCRGCFIQPPQASTPAVIIVDLVRAARHPGASRTVLLHEMIHLYLYVTQTPQPGHGPAFMAELARLGARGEAWWTVNDASIVTAFEASAAASPTRFPLRLITGGKPRAAPPAP
jgi:SprT-like family